MPRKEEAVKVEGFESKTGRYLLRQAYDHFYRQHWTLHPEMTVIHVYMRTFRWRTCSSKVHAQLRQIDPNIVRPFASSTSRRSLQMATEDVSKVRLCLQILPFTSTCLGGVKQKQKWQACFEEICFFPRARQTTPFRPLNFKECRYNIANFLDLSPPRNWKMFKN